MKIAIILIFMRMSPVTANACENDEIVCSSYLYPSRYFEIIDRERNEKISMYSRGETIES